MRRILTALVAVAGLLGFAGAAVAGGGCGSGYHTTTKVGTEIATTGQTATDQTTKPVQQTQIPSGTTQ